MEWIDFKAVQRDSGMVMKTKHTVIEEWPTALKLRPGQPGALEEFHLLLSSGGTSSNRYVEWKWAK